MIRFIILLLVLFLISCGSDSGDGDTASDDTDNNSSSDSSYTISGVKTLAVKYSTTIDSTTSDTATVVSGDIPVEEKGFITLSASSTGDVIIAGAAHGMLYYSGDGGVSWYTLEGIGVEEYWTGASVSADGQDIAVSGSSFYVSHDSGDTWTVYPYGDAYDSDTRLAMSDDGQIIIKTGESISNNLDVSYDYGETWSKDVLVADGYDLMALALSSDGARVAALYEGKALKLSDDSGVTWAEAESGAETWADMDMSPNGQVMALLDLGTGLEGYETIDENGDLVLDAKFDVNLSYDGGDTWQVITVEGIQNATAISITDDGSKILVSGINTDDPLMLSEDYGANWEAINTLEKENPNWPHYAHVFSNSGNRIVAMEHSYSVWTSDDSGKTWIKRLEGQGEE